MYKWKSTFSINNKLNKNFIKCVFNILNNGTMYTDLNNKFMGHINALEGPLSIIHVISDHSLDSDDYKFITIKIIYLDKNVLHLTIDGDLLVLHKFVNGHWANCVQKCLKIGRVNLINK